MPSGRDLGLILGRGKVHRHSLHGVGDLKLAAKTAVVLRLQNGLQHTVFHIAGRGELIKPGRVDIAVAGAAATGAAALRKNAVYAVVDSRAHQALAALSFGFPGVAIVVDEGNINLYNNFYFSGNEKFNQSPKSTSIPCRFTA